MDSTCIKQTVCKVLKIFQYGKYLVAYVLNLVFDMSSTMSQPLKVPVYGHSFVCRLLEFVQSGSDHINLGLDFATFQIEFNEQGGLSLNHRLLESFDESLRVSDILFVDLGSNDLSVGLFQGEKGQD